MPSQRPSRRSKASKKSPQRSPQRRWKAKAQKKGPRKAEAGNRPDTVEIRCPDLIDIINNTNNAKGLDEDDAKVLVEVRDEGLDEFVEDSSFVESTASGPSPLHLTSPKKPRTLQVLCKTCKTLYKKARRMKAPVKNKILDKDPKSLTCDQWVLIKKCRPRKLHNAKRKILIHVKMVKKRLIDMNYARRPRQRVGEEQPSACSRPHPFLQRNLRRCIKVPVKKERKTSRRKRTRDGSHSPHVSKQKRPRSDRRRHSRSTNRNDLHPSIGDSGSDGFESGNDEGVRAGTNLTAELIPPPVTQETTRTTVPPKEKAHNKKQGFRDLLAQLYGNSSMIVKEKR